MNTGESSFFVSSVKKVGELLLPPFIQSLWDQLVVPEFLDFVRGAGLEENLDKWKKTLSRIQTMLDDAEEKQHSDRAVKEWLDDLRDLAYDLDDIVDELTTEASKAENQDRPSKVRKLTPVAWFTRLTPSHFKIKSRLGEITDRFNDIETRKNQLNLKQTADGRSSNKRRWTAAPTSVMNDSHVYGREKDTEAMLELLLGEKYSKVGVSVIPILGMGGIGKTTLAQLLFNDEKVQSFFELKAWACVSEDFDAVRVTKAIIKSATAESCDETDLNLLQVQVKEKLKGKRFLVVLDDMWNESYHDWTILCAPFLAGAPGSRIVITTRNQRVSSMMSTIPAYCLKVLSNDACLSIFTQHALGTSNFSAHPNLKDIGEKIVEKCKGLPLAAKTLGGLLRTTLDRYEWEGILKSKIWDIPEERSRIVPALMLSYHHLPSHLKRCFAYCSILPKDYEFEEEQVVLLWMAEGLIQPPKGNKQMKDLGSQYFCDLLSRSFFQHSSMKKSKFLMHDLINDLAQWVAGDICFKMEDRIEGINKGKISKRVRHLSYLGDYFDGAKKFEVFSELTCLRTFMPLMLPNMGMCYLTHDVPFKLLSKLPCLRVLSFSGYRIVELPDSIGDLKHLRYLDLSYTQIRGLPESITTLCTLQTLILERCSYLVELPSNFGNLVNLRHFNILNAYKLEGMPPQIGKLTSLQTLSNLIVRKDNCFALKDLGYLLHLRGTLIISRLENAIEPRDASDAKLIEKPNLAALCLEWSANVDWSQDRASELDILNMLHPNKSLKELIVRCYGGTEFPTWLKGHSFPHMVLLRIEN
ncbi:putative disease resistance RPP13-like protein 1 [Alnus glutinosa]|uniref:putative disease resistance RPP13-like protein 1 n=1 Tax=Alnus glutinosa TaxID=3517 RepID=UPI002D777902|nr:putative disease resistance RPP13-like protein 1 [Alnus glutinosa]XP_062174888.1 putative disease resistance RPP13-like protein 1 [Alnus glutinosa]